MGICVQIFVGTLLMLESTTSLIILFMKQEAENSTITANDLYKLLSKMQKNQLTAEQYFCTTVGLTGSAKSTLLNYLLGVDLVAHNNRDKYQLSFANQADKRRAEDGELPLIGHTQISCTSTPAKYQDNDGNIYYDCPGYFDTQGDYVEIMNCISNSQILREGKKIKILLVIEQSSLTLGRGAILDQFARILSTQFQGGFMAAINSTLLVISKVDQEDVSLKELTDYLSQKMANTSEHYAKLMLSALASEDHIAFLPKPTKSMTGYIKEIKAKLSKLQYFYLTSDGQPAPTPKARNCILRMKMEIWREFQRQKKRVLEDIEKQVSKMADIDAVASLTDCVSIIEQTPKSSRAIIEMLQNVFLKWDIPKSQIETMTSMINLLEFYDRIQNKQSTFQNIDSIREKLNLMKKLAEERFVKTSSDSAKQSLAQKLKKIEAELQAKLQNELQREKKRNEEKIRQLEIQQKMQADKFREIQQDIKKKNEEKERLAAVLAEQKRKAEEEERRAAIAYQQQRSQQHNGPPRSQIPQQYPQHPSEKPSQYSHHNGHQQNGNYSSPYRSNIEDQSARILAQNGIHGQNNFSPRQQMAPPASHIDQRPRQIHQDAPKRSNGYGQDHRNFDDPRQDTSSNYEQVYQLLTKRSQMVNQVRRLRNLQDDLKR